MLCCTIILGVLAAPALLVSRLLRPRRANPLAWRLEGTAESLAPAGGLARRLLQLVRNRVRSFQFAGAGIAHVVRSEPASLIHAAATVIALGSAFLLDITAQDWRWIVLVVFVVWSAEGFNTAIESTCNLLSREFSEHVRIAKDVSAGAVLLVSIGAAVIGLLTFWPYLASRFPLASAVPVLGSSFCRTVP